MPLIILHSQKDAVAWANIPVRPFRNECILTWPATITDEVAGTEWLPVPSPFGLESGTPETVIFLIKSTQRGRKHLVLRYKDRTSSDKKATMPSWRRISNQYLREFSGFELYAGDCHKKLLRNQQSKPLGIKKKEQLVFSNGSA